MKTRSQWWVYFLLVSFSAADEFCSKDDVDCQEDPIADNSKLYKDAMQHSIATSGLTFLDKYPPFRSKEGEPIFYKFLLEQALPEGASKYLITCIVEPTTLGKISARSSALASSYISDCDLMCPIDTNAIQDSATLFDFEEYEEYFHPDSVLLLASVYVKQEELSSLTLKRIRFHLSNSGKDLEVDLESVQVLHYPESFKLDGTPVFFKFQVTYQDNDPQLLCFVDTGKLALFAEPEKRPNHKAARYMKECDFMCNLMDTDISASGGTVAEMFDKDSVKFEEKFLIEKAISCIKKSEFDKEGSNMMKSRLVIWLATVSA